jgi:hypothetical protein
VTTSYLITTDRVSAADLLGLARQEAGEGDASVAAPVWKLPLAPAGPDGIVLVTFTTAGADETAEWDRHAGFARALGRWLDDQAARWAWQFTGGPWSDGTVPAERPGGTR